MEGTYDVADADEEAEVEIGVGFGLVRCLGRLLTIIRSTFLTLEGLKRTAGFRFSRGSMPLVTWDGVGACLESRPAWLPTRLVGEGRGV